MDHLIGESGELGWVSLKALLLYLTAVIGFRLGERRTLIEMSPFDFVAAVAVGAIVGRVPNASTTSYLAGAVTLVTLLLAHRIITQLRYFPSIADLVDPPPRVLIAHGQVLKGELRQCGLTLNDLHGLLRQRGVEDLREVQFVICEQRGQISIIRQKDRTDTDSSLIRDIVARISSPP
ncbi:DUF421 domain-containing protein [Nitrosococcus oceani]|uniref:Membrane protein-like protein n=2 Tax=Nitrosococcus oceani TaxID=1229 RepID=Q3J6Z3_NITOC|nr:YetF domain-containing protein [Nitrosococcus oceani]ABA59403.1 membrane protein-like protein [Nitrosococcus oceani ATCC 19707]GEM20025.1 membrane protein [Nitrosococcus oceani]